MSQKEPTMDTLLSENYTLEQSLSYQNRKTIAKMFRYIKTFSLGEYEIELIRKDILGMAAESEQRNEPLAEVMGKDPKIFCNDLLEAIGGIKVPRGRTCLRTAGWFYQMIGWLNLIPAIFSLCAILLGYVSAGTLLSGDPITEEMMFSIIISVLPAVLYIFAGHYAKKYSGDASRAGSALRWGIALMLFVIIYPILNNIIPEYLAIEPRAYTTNEQILMGAPSILLSYIFPLLYMAGAYMNKKSVQ